MNTLFITINEKEYALKFGFGALKIFCNAYGEDKISAISKYLKPLKDIITDPTFESLEVLANIILAGIKHNSKKSIQLDLDDVMDNIMTQAEKIAEILVAFTDSLPKVDTLGKQNAVKKKPQRKK